MVWLLALGKCGDATNWRHLWILKDGSRAQDGQEEGDDEDLGFVELRCDRGAQRLTVESEARSGEWNDAPKSLARDGTQEEMS